jgi:hypothetical protein
MIAEWLCAGIVRQSIAAPKCKFSNGVRLRYRVLDLFLGGGLDSSFFHFHFNLNFKA